MGAPRKPPETKVCEGCGKTMTRRRWANGKLEKGFHKRRFHSLECFNEWRRVHPYVGTENTARRQAQAMYPATECSRCGVTTGLHRHHEDRNPYNNSHENITILCSRCHVKAHCEGGDWGCGNVLPAECRVCGIVFQPKRSRRAEICDNPECLKEMGRRSAAARWEGHTRERTCAYCGEVFVYKRVREVTCSRVCGGKLAWETRREKVATQ